MHRIHHINFQLVRPLLASMFLLLIFLGNSISLCGQRTGADTIRFTIRDTTFVAGDTLAVWVNSPSSMTLSGIQFGLAYDTTRVKLVALSSPTIPKSDVRSQYDNGIRKQFIYNAGGNDLNIEKKWLKLVFLPRVDGLLSKYIQWSKTFQSFVVNTDLDDIPLKIEIEKITSTSDENHPLSLHLYPNPCGDFLRIQTPSTDPSKYQVSIMDPSGRPVKARLQSRVFGEHLLQIDLPRELTPGLYYLHLEGGKLPLNRTFIRH